MKKNEVTLRGNGGDLLEQEKLRQQEDTLRSAVKMC
jgi:hypothetical protein